jgi:hypothetical protein
VLTATREPALQGLSQGKGTAEQQQGQSMYRINMELSNCVAFGLVQGLPPVQPTRVCHDDRVFLSTMLFELQLLQWDWPLQGGSALHEHYK